MKIIKSIILISFLALVFIGCSKTVEITITEDNFTTCQPSFTCNYTFTNNARVDSIWSIQSGMNRVFLSEEKQLQSPNINRSIFFIAPQNDRNFILSNSDIANGKVKYISGCPACFSKGYTPVGGIVKGVNLTPEKSDSQSKWLLEATIYLAADLNTKGDQKFKDTIYMKQYFYSNALNN